MLRCASTRPQKRTVEACQGTAQQAVRFCQSLIGGRRSLILVTNGGYGTINLALKAGVPILVAGLTEDKAEVAARVAWSGAGVNLATNNPTTEAIRAGVDDVLTHPHYRSHAQELAAAFAAIDTPREIMSILDRVARRTDSVAA